MAKTRKRIVTQNPLQHPLEKKFQEMNSKSPKKENQKVKFKPRWGPGRCFPRFPPCFLLLACFLHARPCHASHDLWVCARHVEEIPILFQSTGPLGPLGRAPFAAAMASDGGAARSAQQSMPLQQLQEMRGWRGLLETWVSGLQPYVGTFWLCLLWMWNHNGNFLFYPRGRKKHSGNHNRKLCPLASINRQRRKFGICRKIRRRRYRWTRRKFRMKQMLLSFTHDANQTQSA